MPASAPPTEASAPAKSVASRVAKTETGRGERRIARRDPEEDQRNAGIPLAFREETSYFCEDLMKLLSAGARPSLSRKVTNGGLAAAPRRGCDVPQAGSRASFRCGRIRARSANPSRRGRALPGRPAVRPEHLRPLRGRGRAEATETKPKAMMTPPPTPPRARRPQAGAT